MQIHIILKFLLNRLIFLRSSCKLLPHLLFDVLHVDWCDLGPKTLELRDVVLVHSFVPAIDDIECIFQVYLEPHYLFVAFDHPAD